jgi:hypothetical protein
MRADYLPCAGAKAGCSRIEIIREREFKFQMAQTHGAEQTVLVRKIVRMRCEHRPAGGATGQRRPEEKDRRIGLAPQCTGRFGAAGHGKKVDAARKPIPAVEHDIDPAVYGVRLDPVGDRGHSSRTPGSRVACPQPARIERESRWSKPRQLVSQWRRVWRGIDQQAAGIVHQIEDGRARAQDVVNAPPSERENAAYRRQSIRGRLHSTWKSPVRAPAAWTACARGSAPALRALSGRPRA